MSNYFEVKIKSLKVDQSGAERNVTDTVLIDAVSYTDAETRAYEIAQEITKREFKIVGIKDSNISDVIDKKGEFFYKVKASMRGLDETSGREKKTNQYVLVTGDDIQQALLEVEIYFSIYIVPTVVECISLSPISDVYPYNLNKEE